MGKPKLWNRAICERNHFIPTCKHNCGSQTQRMAKVHFKILHRIRNSNFWSLSLWVNTKIFPLPFPANWFEDNLFRCKAEYINVNVVFISSWCQEQYYPSDTFPLPLWKNGKHGSKAGVQSSHKRMKRHHFDSASPRFTELCSKCWILCSFQNNNNWKRNSAIKSFPFHIHTL